VNKILRLLLATMFLSELSDCSVGWTEGNPLPMWSKGGPCGHLPITEGEPGILRTNLLRPRMGSPANGSSP